MFECSFCAYLILESADLYALRGPKSVVSACAAQGRAWALITERQLEMTFMILQSIL